MYPIKDMNLDRFRSADLDCQVPPFARTDPLEPGHDSPADRNRGCRRATASSLASATNPRARLGAEHRRPDGEQGRLMTRAADHQVHPGVAHSRPSVPHRPGPRPYALRKMFLDLIQNVGLFQAASKIVRWLDQSRSQPWIDFSRGPGDIAMFPRNKAAPPQAHVMTKAARRW